MKTRDAFELTIALCRREGAAGSGDGRVGLLGRAADRTAFHAYAMRQGVLGLALSTLRRQAHPFDGATINAILAPLRTLSQQARLWDMERNRVLALLAREGLSPVLLKGAALRVTTYRAAVERPVGDLDLLVPAEEMDRTVERLLAAGYRMPESAAAIEGFREHHFHLPMHHPNGFEAELHWALTPRATTHRLDHDDFIARARTAEVDGLAVRLPIPEHMLLHLSSQNTEDHFSKLRRIVDIDRVIASGEPDWEFVIAEARRGGLEAPTALSLQLAHHLFGTSIPAALPARLGVGRTTRAALALLEPVSTLATGRGPTRAVARFLQEVWLAPAAARAQHLKRVVAGEDDPLEWLWRGEEEAQSPPAERRRGVRLAAALALYQCWIVLCAPASAATADGRRDLRIWDRAA
ncbi:MAG TPA: nucleotidyltransferase family protein [Gemmatimonadales bacterium]